MDNSKATSLSHSGKRLQKLRELQGLSRRELAEELGVESAVLILWESEGGPDEFIKECCFYFEVPNSIFR